MRYLWPMNIRMCLDDLLGMPPDRAIKFKIELQSGTAPIYKRPYPMV
jgi:hypothetical protein